MGGIEYLVQSNNNTDYVEEEDRFKYVDDLSILEVLCLTGFLIEYDVHKHVPSDIGTEQMFLPPEVTKTQNNLNEVSRWTDDHMMTINVKKTNYMLFTRTKTDFATRLMLNGVKIDQIKEQKICGLWITDNLRWEKNSRELAKSAFSSMFTLYILFTRSVLEYCSVVF